MGARSTEAWEIAVESLDLAAGPRIRPSPWRWFWYAYWVPLPARHQVWVLYDSTCSTWVLRHFARILVAAAPPVLAIVLFLPAPPGLRALTALVAGSCAVLFTATWINEATEYRLVRAGYDWGVGPAVRARRDEFAQRLRRW